MKLSSTEIVVTNPKDPRTQDDITGRFGRPGPRPTSFSRNGT